MSKNLITYGDQLIASPGQYNGFNVKRGEHWWELLGKDFDNVTTLHNPSKEHTIGISPLFYASTILKSNIDNGYNDFFISVMPSSNRSLHWDVTGPIHNITDSLGPHITHEYCEWQSNFTYDILNNWSQDKKCLIFIQESHKQSTDKLIVIPYINRGDINQFWGWVMEQHPDLTNVGSFYKDCAPDRKLNAYGHKCVYEVVRKYIIR